MLLFPADLELDLDYLRRGLASGRLSSERVDEAVLRVLALKAALGLHRLTDIPPVRSRSRALVRTYGAWAGQCAREAITLVHDRDSFLPLSPRTHRRVLLIEEPVRENFYGVLLRWTPIVGQRIG